MALLILALFAAAPSAHDIPNDVTVQTFLKPEGPRLRLLVRAPLQAMRDMDYPKPRGTRNADLLDLARADSTLQDAATLWNMASFGPRESRERLMIGAAERVGMKAILIHRPGEDPPWPEARTFAGPKVTSIPAVLDLV